MSNLRMVCDKFQFRKGVFKVCPKLWLCTTYVIGVVQLYDCVDSDSTFLRNVILGDETWIRVYESDNQHSEFSGNYAVLM